MSVRRWDIERGAPAWVASKGEFVKHADHARIVAEAGAAVFAFHPEWTVTGMCDSDCLACRRLTELITEREKGYEEGKADAEQEHAAAWDRATFDSTAYEQGKRDAAEEARAAERRHWEARFRNAEAAHAAALAEAADRQRARDYVSLWSRLMLEDRKYRAALARAAIVIRQRLTDSDVFRLTGQHVRLHEWETVKPLPADKAAAPRTLTADDPEPAVTSVGLDRDQSVWQRVGSTEHSRWVNPFMGTREWPDVLARGPVRLIHDGGAA